MDSGEWQKAVDQVRQAFNMHGRDAARISELLAEIERIWREHPDLRLMQLLSNCLEGISPHYNVEDTDLLERLRALYK